MISKYHLFIDDIKLRDLVNNHDLRFFKHRKHLLNKLLDENNGFVIKTSSWDTTNLLKDYETTNKLEHPNVIRHYCYFEYESDIIQYLAEQYTGHEDVSVIITPFYHSCSLDKEEKKQLVFLLCYLFFEKFICFSYIDIDNIRVNKNNKKKSIKYKFLDMYLEICTENIVIFDNFEHSYKIFDYSHRYKLFQQIQSITSCNFSYQSENNIDIFVKEILPIVE